MNPEDADVVEVRLGDGAKRALVRFMHGWDGFACEHRNRPQVALATGTTSTCWGCAISTGAVEGWTRALGCTVCGRAQDANGRLWLVPLGEVSTVALRLCSECSHRELNPEEGTMVTREEVEEEGALPCAVCRSTVAGEFARAWMHPECIEAAEGSALVASGDAAVERRLLIARARGRWAS